jgi:nickel/cobalt exporter
MYRNLAVLCLALLLSAGMASAHTPQELSPVEREIEGGILAGLEGEAGFWGVLPLFLLALGLGILHSLAPGHGKALIVSYLVGHRATYRNAVLLGFSTAATHVADVFIILALSIFFMETFPQVFVSNMLQLLGIALILGFSLWGLARASRNLKAGHHHSHTAKHSHGPGSGSRQAIWFGIITGLAPCPLAWVIFFAALSIGRLLLGGVLLVTFSLGLSLSITAMALLFVKFKKGFGPGERYARYLPLVSYILVLALGIWMLLAFYSSAGFSFRML